MKPEQTIGERSSRRLCSLLAAVCVSVGSWSATALEDASPEGVTAADLRQLTAAYRAAGEPWKAVRAAEDFLERTGEDTEAAVTGYNQLGIALALAAPGDPEKLREAEQAFRRALALSGGAAEGARLNLAALLIRLGREAEARQLLAGSVSPEKATRWTSLSMTLALAGEAQWAPLRAAEPPQADEEPSRARPVRPEPVSPEQVSAREPMRVGGDVKPPHKKRCPMPSYTEDARKARIQGVVTLKLLIDEKGEPHLLEVVEELPLGLTEAAIEAILRCRFEPATFHGKPVPVYHSLTTNFTLQ